MDNETLFFHEYFAFETGENVGKLISYLQSQEFQLTQSSFLDEYYETEAKELKEKALFLRKRDNRWTLLKVLKEERSTILKIYPQTDEKLIISALKNHGISHEVNMDNTWLQQSLRSIGYLISPLQRMCPRRVALFPTCRITLRSKDHKTEVCIDTYNSNDTFYTVGTINTQFNNPQKHVLRDAVMQFTVFPNQSCLYEPLVRYASRSHSSDLHVSFASNDIWQKSTFKGIPYPLIPYDYFDRATETATGALLPLQVAYNTIIEDECRDKFETDKLSD